MSARDRLALPLVAGALALSACISMKVELPRTLRTDALIPPDRGGAPPAAQFAVRYEAFLDDRSDRSSIGYAETAGGQTAILPDKDITEVFQKVVTRAFERKGVRDGPSPFLVKATVHDASATSFLSDKVDASVALELSLINSKTQALLWSRSYEGKAAGGDFQGVLAAAFRDLSSSIENDDSILQERDAFLAAGGKVPSSPATPGSQWTSDADKAPRRGGPHPDDYALIVGIEGYQSLPPAQFGERDARTFARYVRDTLGVPKENTIVLTGEQATRAGIAGYIEEWLPRNVNKRSRVYVYYSGHGSADASRGTAYLIPWDGNPSFLESSAYSMPRLYEKLQALNAREVVVMLDSCFSGAGGRSVIAKGARPLVTVNETSLPPESKLSVLAASAGNEIAGSLDDQGHGLFTYFLLKGLQGAAADSSGHVTLAGLYGFLKDRVPAAAHHQNREQTPQLHAADARLALY